MEIERALYPEQQKNLHKNSKPKRQEVQVKGETVIWSRLLMQLAITWRKSSHERTTQHQHSCVMEEGISTEMSPNYG